jgi:hypothetical protein
MASVDRCDCGSSAVADMLSLRGRERLRPAVWSPSEHGHGRQAIGAAEVVGYAGGVLLPTIKFAFDAATGQHSSIGEMGELLGLGALLAGISGLGMYLRLAWRKKKARCPSGARDAPSFLVLGRGGQARPGIAQGEPFFSPLRRQPCLAFEISLRTDNPHDGGPDLLWREAHTEGFLVQLDDGETVRIPAGPIRMSRAPESARVEHASARQRLPFELRYEADSHHPCVPSDSAFEQLVRPGDPVVVVGPLVAREDVIAVRASLRAPSRMVLVPAGTFMLATQDG